METVKLVNPSIQFKNSFEAYTLAYKETEETHYFNKYKPALENFELYISTLQNQARGINLKQGDVSVSTFWLVDKTTVVGVVRVRHKELDTAGHIGYDISPTFRNKGYGTQILKLALSEAYKLGIMDAVLTCNIDNTGSRKIIKKNNGVLLGTIFDEEENETLYKYIIKTCCE